MTARRASSTCSTAGGCCRSSSTRRRATSRPGARPGPGRWVTIYASADHIFMYVAGLRWDTHNAAGPGDGTPGSAGTRWYGSPRGSSCVTRWGCERRRGSRRRPGSGRGRSGGRRRSGGRGRPRRRRHRPSRRGGTADLRSADRVLARRRPRRLDAARSHHRDRRPADGLRSHGPMQPMSCRPRPAWYGWPEPGAVRSRPSRHSRALHQLGRGRRLGAAAIARGRQRRSGAVGGDRGGGRAAADHDAPAGADRELRRGRGDRADRR